MNVDDVTKLKTESRNPKTTNIGNMNGHKVAQLINSEDFAVAEAIEKVTGSIGDAIEQASIKFQNGGRLIYIGAGTSGRLGALDAIELTPTYGVPATRAFGLLAGGKKAMYEAVEGAEDSKELALEDLKNVNLNSNDVVISLSASGRTPYALSAIEYGNEIGSLTIAVICNPDSPMAKTSNIAVAPVVGPEVVTGSTRMKAGSAQKMILNIISTGIMIKSGYVYENLMINVQPTNEKLVARSIGIIEQILKVKEEVAREIFNNSHKNIAVGLIMFKLNLSYEEAINLFEKNQRNIHKIAGMDK
ncbi:N-acetylmuramic acid 6-phosphate etherase [Companilactobacillus heilongjiangensis]|uniref:N-acetylmuramic acid 6-phosphate etherase n=1 Tax=Companilactobacillus heilongjiangensis TaxID=1074467 RepID=A0A0K2LBJ4_9LACO|nr:N-acetylmuramic acid 6-phosphate etherase [Companilactobacillus heilongjiangensis]ALB28630.1 N-acetylmuramic acid-6-phosphate etherase [Companilactobacillus heilongjiangensis]